ncbi:hypothetical protein BV20DRAFT_1055922 [Pilatotrama ljubarskyi]|nr:hypothetical protein BV20DRAFT_1055922 [Pilatotrama ljubarskyi]
MLTFCYKHEDPHLAISMFDHARHLCIVSYRFNGYTIPAYHELTETRWRCFRDLRGVVEALEEMRVNGFELDSGRTRLLGKTTRREVWILVARLEGLVPPENPRRRSKQRDKDDG